MSASTHIATAAGGLTVDQARRAVLLGLCSCRRQEKFPTLERAGLPDTPAGRAELLWLGLEAGDAAPVSSPEWLNRLAPVADSDPSPWGQWGGRTSLADLQELGVLPEALINFFAVLGSELPKDDSTDRPREVLSPLECEQLWSPDRLASGPVRFDFELLRRLNHSWLQRADHDRLTALALPYYRRVGWVPEPSAEPVRVWLRELIRAVLPGLDFLSLLPPRTRLVFDYHAEHYLRVPESREALEREGARDVLRAFARRALEESWLTPERFRAIFAEVRRETRQTGRNLIQPIRVLLTGLPFGPSLDDLLPLIERGAELDLPVRVKPCRERVLEFCSVFV